MSIRYKDGREINTTKNEQVSTPAPSSDSSSGSKILIFVLIGLAIILSLFAIFAVSSVGNNQTQINDDIDKLQSDVVLLTTATSNVSASNSILQQKTTDLTYSNNTSNFSKNLNVGQTLTVNGKNISDILDSIANESGDIIVTNNLLVDGIIYAEDKNVNQTLWYIESSSNSTNFSKDVEIAGNLFVSGKNIGQSLNGITNTTSGTNFSTNIIVNQTVSSQNVEAVNGDFLNLSVNDKDIGQTLSTITTDDDTTTISNNLVVQNNTTSANFILSNSDDKTLQQIRNLAEDNRMLITSGTGTTFENAIYSNGSIGLVNSNAECKVILNPDNGDIKANSIQLNETISFKNSFAGFMITTANSNTEITGTYLITMSVINLIPSAQDDIWIINPGFKFIVYDQLNYAGNSFQFDNTNSNQTMYITLPYSTWNPNLTKSLKIFYKNQEINPISSLSQ